MRRLALTALLALTACATALPQVVERDGDAFDVRYDAAVHTQAEVDAKANTHCSGGAASYVSQQTGFDGFAYRTYRCAPR
jgi:putative hemolysin